MGAATAEGRAGSDTGGARAGASPHAAATSGSHPTIDGFDARHFAARVGGIPGSAIDRSIALLAKQTHPVVPFAFGAPAPEAIPTELLARFAAEAYRDQGHTALGDPKRPFDAGGLGART